MTKYADWQGSVPSIAEFENIVADAWERLPEEFRERASDLLIRVDDFATDDVLDALGIDDPYNLLGLYHGVALNHKSVLDVARQPDMVFLYRRPILEQWAAGADTLGGLIKHVLIHEIGHHFGFSDDDMERIEADAGP